MGKHSREQKLARVEDELNLIFFFSARENVQYMQEIRLFPEEGIDMFLGLIDEAKGMQDKFFAETIKANPEFAKAFSRFLTQTTNQIKQQYELTQHNDAENILTQL